MNRNDANTSRSVFCNKWDDGRCIDVDIDKLMKHLVSNHYDLIADMADESKEHDAEVAIFLCETKPGELEPTRLQIGENEAVEISDCPPDKGIAVALHTHRCWERGVIGDPSPADMIASYADPEWDALGVICPKTKDDAGIVDFTLVTDFHNLPPDKKRKLDAMIRPWLKGNDLDLKGMYDKAPLDYLDASIILKNFSKFRYWRFWEDQKPGLLRVEVPKNFEAITEEKVEEKIEEREFVDGFPKDWTPKMRQAAKNYCSSLGIPMERCYESTRKMFEGMKKAFSD